MIAALNKEKIVAPMTFEGYCDTEVFNGWFEQFLAPILQPGQTVILDNATFHKSKKTVEFAKSIGVDILYLPPYSPDFNQTIGLLSKTESGKTFLFLNLFARLSTLLFFICSHYNAKICDNIDHFSERNNNINIRKRCNLTQWKRQTGYGIRSRIESFFFRLKKTFGFSFKNKSEINRSQEMLLKCYLINKFSDIGMPIFELIS